MTNSLMKLDVVDSENEIFSGQVNYLVAPAFDGEVGIYPHHVSLITKLKPGVLRIVAPNTSQLIFAISGGFLEVHNNHVTVLADVIERTEALDRDRLLKQQQEALEQLKSSSRRGDRMHVSLEIAIAQLKALDYIKQHGN